MTPCNIMQTKHEILQEHLFKYFQDDQAMATLSSVLLDNKLSLRLIDYFVCTYSKIFNVSYKVNDAVFNVFIAYKSILKGYNKKFFDCFCRRDRIQIFSQTHNKIITTTVGQLHFFAWAIKNRIIDYVEEHAEEIEQHMIDSFQMKKKTQGPTTTRKKYTVQASNQKGITATRVQLLLNFE